MSETLHKILVRHISLKLSEATEEERKETVEAFETKIEKEVVEEKSNELTLAQTKKLEQKEKELELERLGNLMDQAKNAFWMAGIIGLLIGLLVNQVTDVISALKGISPGMPILVTLGICCVLLIICIGTMYLLYLHKVSKIIKKYVQKDEV